MYMYSMYTYHRLPPFSALPFGCWEPPATAKETFWFVSTTSEGQVGPTGDRTAETKPLQDRTCGGFELGECETARRPTSWVRLCSAWLTAPPSQAPPAHRICNMFSQGTPGNQKSPIS